jgi:hypothetical protein
MEFIGALSGILHSSFYILHSAFCLHPFDKAPDLAQACRRRAVEVGFTSAAAQG